MKVTKTASGYVIEVPHDVVATLGLRDGDDIELRQVEPGVLAVVSERERRAALVRRIREFAVDFPADYRFDREEANAR